VCVCVFVRVCSCVCLSVRLAMLSCCRVRVKMHATGAVDGAGGSQRRDSWLLELGTARCMLCPPETELQPAASTVACDLEPVSCVQLIHIVQAFVAAVLTGRAFVIDFAPPAVRCSHHTDASRL